MTRHARWSLAVCIAALAACDNAGPGGTIVINPATAALCIGDSLAFTAKVVDVRGDTVSTSQVRWSSSAPEAVAIDPASGVARALAFGSAQITAMSGSATSAKPGQLDVPSDLSPEFVPDTVVLAPSDTFTLGVRLRRLSAGPVPSRTPAIAPLDATVARLDATGLVTAKAPGTATFSLAACGFTGHGAARVYTPPDSVTGLGYLWLSGPFERRVSFGTVAWNLTLSSKKPAFQVYSGAGRTTRQFAYEDTLRLTGVGAFPVDSLLSTQAPTAECSPPGPFAVYSDPVPTALVSLRGGSAAVTTYMQLAGYRVIAGRVVTRMRGTVGSNPAVDTLQAIYTFSAPLRDTTTACP
jgi:hypothetical protein